jgi:hypothetical protein
MDLTTSERPRAQKEHLQKYRKLGWMMLGLIAPELIVWNAWEQRRLMKYVSKLMQEKGFMPAKLKLWTRVHKGVAKVWHWTLNCLFLEAKDLPEFVDPTPHRKYNGRTHPWTDVHSWYVAMGGMSFEDSAEEDEQFMPENRQRVNITVERFAFMLEVRDHLIPDISREYIQDKSKSDRLAKLLTCWQAGYFCIQCVFRLSQQLSVTLLELNVFAHALCALALFAIWTDKPRDVCEPTLVVGEEAMDICASSCVHTFGTDEKKNFDGYRVMNPPYGHDPDRTLEIVRPTSFSVTFSWLNHRDFSSGLCYGVFHECTTLKMLETHWVLVPKERLKWSRQVTPFTLNLRDLRRLQRASRFLQQHHQEYHTFSLASTNLPSRWDGHSIARTHNWGLFNSDGDAIYSIYNGRVIIRALLRFVRLAAGVTFAGVCYGGLHLVAWKTPFASSAEALLWRAASVSIMTVGPFYAIAAVCDAYVHKFNGIDERTSKATFVFKPLSNVIIQLIFLGSLILWYVFCRMFIIVESFIMLAHIPDQALQVPTWSAYIHHIV